MFSANHQWFRDHCMNLLVIVLIAEDNKILRETKHTRGICRTTYCWSADEKRFAPVVYS